MSHKTDEDYMRDALHYARRGLGRVWPNPSVGCVLVKGGIVIARGRTADGGRPHAETIALEKAGAEAHGTCAYMTLEPCAHHGQTGPCAKALVEAGVRRVVIGCLDPYEQVAGRGVEILKKAGIEVIVGVLEEEARTLHKGFILRVTKSRPEITQKMAVSADGFIAGASRKRTKISGPEFDVYVQYLRCSHDAVMVGIETALADDPLLTARLGGAQHKNARIVLDTDLRLPLDGALVRSAGDYPLWVVHDCADEGRQKNLSQKGVILIRHDPRDLKGVMAELAQRGITRLLVEGGARLHSSLLEAGLSDHVLVCRAPIKIGEGVKPLAKGNLADLTVSLGFVLKKTRGFGQDLLEFYERKA